MENMEEVTLIPNSAAINMPVEMAELPNGKNNSSETQGSGGDDPQPKKNMSYKDAVSNKSFKEVLFDERAEIWSSDDEVEGESESQTFDLNMDLSNEDPMLPTVDIPSKLMRRLHRQWKDNLIVKLLGKNIGFKALGDRVRALWNLQGVLKIVDLDEGFYLFKFDTKEDFHHVFTNGPWIIMNHYLTVRKWEPNFKLSEAVAIPTAVWVRLPELPIEYYGEKPIFQIAKRLGRLIKTDYNTASSSRGKYARVCIEVDLAKPLVPAYLLAGKKYNVVYEFIHQLCFKCGKVGHRADLCREFTAAPVINTEPTTSMATEDTISHTSDPELIEGLSGLVSLETLNLSSCLLEKFPDLSNLKSLKTLGAGGCDKLREIEGLSGLVSLETLNLSSCSLLEKLPDLSNLISLKTLVARGCDKLREIEGLEELKKRNCFIALDGQLI